MSSARIVRHSLRALPRHRMRTAFMMLGSFVGAAALTLVLAVGDAAKRKTLATVRQLFGASSIVVMAGGTELLGGPRAGAARLTLEDLQAVATSVPEIAAWDAQQAMPNAPVRHAGAAATARVLGATERYERVWDRSVSSGSVFDAAAVRASARVAMIGETVRRALFAGADPLGAEIDVGGVPFQVIGVLQAFGTDLHGLDRDDEIVVPLTTLQRRLLNVDTVIMGKFLTHDQDQVSAANKEVRRVLRERHGLPAGRPDDFRLISAVAVQQMVAKMQRVLQVYLPLVSLAALLVGGIVAATLMLVSVSQRVGEIGLRRALGARARDVGLQFLLETAVTALGGGGLGIGTGLLVARLVAARMTLGGVFSWQAVLLSFAAAAVTGLLAGVLPARRAARLLPADALR